MQKFDRSIVEGPLSPAVWRLAWPTMLQNVIAGLQGIIDHAMVGHFVGYTASGSHRALARAGLLDVLPVFADPLSRSFLTDGGLNSLLFFMVFFFHMLLPLGMAALLWLHVARVSRPKFLPARAQRQQQPGQQPEARQRERQDDAIREARARHGHAAIGADCAVSG